MLVRWLVWQVLDVEAGVRGGGCRLRAVVVGVTSR